MNIFIFSPAVNLAVFVLLMFSLFFIASGVACYCDRMIRYAGKRIRRKLRRARA